MRLMNHLRKTSNGQWEVRIVVPADCRERIGKSNLTRRLGRVTKSEANRLSADIVAEFKAQIEEARLPPPHPITISPDRAIAALERWRDTEISRVRVERFNDPGYGFPSDITKIGAWIEQSGNLGRERLEARQRLSAGILKRDHDATILSVLGDSGMNIDANHPAMPTLRNNFAQMLIAILDAEDAARSGDYGPIRRDAVPPPSVDSYNAAVSTDDLLDEYAAERQPEPDTLRRWRRALTSLVAHVGHNDATRITPDDVVKWKALRPSLV